MARKIRLGITGLSRSGKTVFISALVHFLISNNWEGTSENSVLRKIKKVQVLNDVDEEETTGETTDDESEISVSSRYQVHERDKRVKKQKNSFFHSGYRAFRSALSPKDDSNSEFLKQVVRYSTGLFWIDVIKEWQSNGSMEEDQVYAFKYEDHINKIVNDRIWPEGTKNISKLTLKIEHKSFLKVIDNHTEIEIVDYPGEWLLDLPLMEKEYAEWCHEAIEQSWHNFRKEPAKQWHDRLKEFDPDNEFNPESARELVELFNNYLRNCRSDEKALSQLPPGRFLIPGTKDLDKILFAPIDVKFPAEFKPGSLGEQFEKNYNEYRAKYVFPFFEKHFSKFDRQIVLIDALPSINAGHDSLIDLQAALEDILGCFNPGKNSWLSTFLPSRRRTDKVLIAATKADQIHDSDHKYAKSMLNALVDSAMKKAKIEGAIVDSMVLASVRTTRQGTTEDGIPILKGIPMKGAKLRMEEGFEISGQNLPLGMEIIGDKIVWDGETECFHDPGSFPSSIQSLFEDTYTINFLDFRPPQVNSVNERTEEIPNIGLGQAIEKLIGDKL